MSAELRTTVYLRCDALADWSSDGRCTVSYGRDEGWPDNGDTLNVLARYATEKGWLVEPKHEGLKGWSASAICPDHAGDAR